MTYDDFYGSYVEPTKKKDNIVKTHLTTERR